MTRRVVVGVGNRWRGDDGAGLAVADAVRRRIVGVDVYETDGEPARLIEAWDGADVAVVVDATSTGGRPGTVRRIDAADVGATRTASSHGLGVAQAIALGRALGRMPARLEVVGIEGDGFGLGPGLSARAAAAVDTAARLAIEIVEGRA